MDARQRAAERRAEEAMRRLCEERLGQGRRGRVVDLEEVARRLGLDAEDWRPARGSEARDAGRQP